MASRRCRVTGKKRFSNEASALIFIDKTNAGPAQFLLGWRLTRAYKCQFCKSWHVTSMEEAVND